MSMKSKDKATSYVRTRVFGVVAAGKPLSRAVWTESRELADDMMSNTTGGAPVELWEATFVARSS